MNDTIKYLVSSTKTELMRLAVNGFLLFAALVILWLITKLVN